MNVIAKQQELVNFIWGISNLLRGTYRPPQYRRVMIPLIVFIDRRRRINNRWASAPGKAAGLNLGGLHHPNIAIYYIACCALFT